MMKSILLKWTLCLAVLLMPLNHVMAEEVPGFGDSTWYDYRDQAFSVEDKGMLNNPIVIETAAQLAQIAWLVNEGGSTFAGKVLVLDADIDLKGPDASGNVTWIPIGKDETKCFRGIFIGTNPNKEGWEKNVHKISNMYMKASNDEYTQYYGLFGYSRGFIGYLSMDNPYIEAKGSLYGYSYAGSICASVNGETVSAYDRSGNAFQVPVSIYSCAVTNGSFDTQYVHDVGGVVGKSKGKGVCHTTFQGVIRDANCQETGGICGSLGDGSIFDCSAQVVFSDGHYIGGIAGYAEEGTRIEACASSGTFSTKDGGSRVGGICGSQSNAVQIVGCSSSADITSPGNIGGISGVLGVLNFAPVNSPKISCCVFSGNLHPYGEYCYAGGICGSLLWDNDLFVERCLFLGSMDFPEAVTNIGLIVGGNGNPTNTISSCYIDETISGKHRVSGADENHITVKSLITQQLTTGDIKDTPLLDDQSIGDSGYVLLSRFYPRPYDNNVWPAMSLFKADGCSEACKKLFDGGTMRGDNSVYLPQTWLCSVPVVIRKGDSAWDFVSTADASRANATFELTDGSEMKLSSSCTFPQSDCVTVENEKVIARGNGSYVLPINSSTIVATSFDRPKMLEGRKDLTLTVTAGQVWDGTIASEFAYGTGIAEDPYVIKNGAQLAHAVLDNNVGEFYEQICDITLHENRHASPTNIDLTKNLWFDWEWPKHESEWKANYNGTGHYVKGPAILQDNVGFFGHITADGSVANLGIVDAHVSIGAGVFADKMDGTITNCIAQGTATVPHTRDDDYYLGYSGGICSTVGEENPEALIEDCISAVYSYNWAFADWTPFVSLSDKNQGTVSNCLAVVPMLHQDKNYQNGDITASGKSYIKDCYWLKGYEEYNSGYTLEEISTALGSRSLWQVNNGYFPTLATFASTDMAKLLMLPFRTDIDYTYNEETGESDNYLYGFGRQILFEPGAATWTSSDPDNYYIEADADMGVIVPVEASFNPADFHPETHARTIGGLKFLTCQLGSFKHSIPMRPAKNEVNPGFTFEDPNARQACLDAFDSNHDDVLSLAEVKAITTEQTLTAFQTETAHRIVTFPEFRFFKMVSELASQLNGLDKLESIQLPYGLQTIGANAFSGCTNLNEVTLPARVTTVMPGALVGSSLENIFVDPLNANFTSHDGVLFTKRDDLVAYPNGRNGVEATISGTVRSILEGAFYKVPGLRQLFFDTTDYTTVAELESGGIVTDDGSLVEVYVSDATYDRVLISDYLIDDSWQDYVKADKLHQYFPLKIGPEVTINRDGTTQYIGTMYIGFATQLPKELTPYIFNALDEYEFKAYYHEKTRLVPAIQPIMVMADEPGTYRLLPADGDVEQWPVYENWLIGVGRDGMPVNQGTSEQGSIMTPQMKDGQPAFLYEKKSMIDPYHCYLTFQTVGRPAEVLLNAHYDLIQSDQTQRQVTEKGFVFNVVSLLPDGEEYATLTAYTGQDAYLWVPQTLQDGTPIIQIAPNAFNNSSIRSIDMTSMYDLDPISNDRSDPSQPLSGLDERAFVFLPEGKGTPGNNIILGQECATAAFNEGWDYYAPLDFHADKVCYDRVLKAVDNGDGTWTSKAYTICLPYDANLAVSSEDTHLVNFFQLMAVNDKREFVFRDNFSSIMAGVPTVVVVNKGDYRLEAEDAYVVATPTNSGDVNTVYDTLNGAISKTGTQVGWWRGTFQTISNEEGTERYLFGMSNGAWKIVRNDTETYRKGYIPPFRAFFEPLEFDGYRGAYTSKFYYNNSIFSGDTSTMQFDSDLPDYDDPSGINPVIHTIDRNGTDRYYDLQGRQLSGKPAKGIYINNGKKIVIKYE